MSASFIGPDLSQLSLDKPQRCTFTRLPPEIHYQIGVHLPYWSLLNLIKCSHALYSSYIYAYRTFNERSTFLRLPESIHRIIASYVRGDPNTYASITYGTSVRQLVYMTYLCKKAYEIYDPLFYSIYARTMSRRSHGNYRGYRVWMYRPTDFPSVKALERIFRECGWQSQEGQNFAKGLVYRFYRNRMRRGDDNLPRARESFMYLMENLRLVEDETSFKGRAIAAAESLLTRGVVWAVEYADMVGSLESGFLGDFLNKAAKRVHDNTGMMELLLEISSKRRKDGDPLVEEIFDRKNLDRLAREVLTWKMISDSITFNTYARAEEQKELVRSRVESKIGALKALLSIDPDIDLTSAPSEQAFKDSPSSQYPADEIPPGERLDYDYLALPQFVALGGNPELFRKLTFTGSAYQGKNASLLHAAVHPYLICTSHTDFFNHVLKYNTSPIDLRAGKHGDTALLKAVKLHLNPTAEENNSKVPFSHYLTCITTLLAAGASITAKNDLGISPLSLAIIYKDTTLLSLFTPTNPDIHLETPINSTHLTFPSPSPSVRNSLVNSQIELIRTTPSLAHPLILRALLTYFSGYFRPEILTLLAAITFWSPYADLDPAEMLDSEGISPVMIAAAWEGKGDVELLHSLTSSLGRPINGGNLQWRKKERRQAMLWLKNGAFWEEWGPPGVGKEELWERVKAMWERERGEGI